MVVKTFYQNVGGRRGKSDVIQFTQDDGNLMLVACLVFHWSDPGGHKPDTWSFAAITDELLPVIQEPGRPADRVVEA
ncbi:hypothetical protein [uncultured Stenotrophomonas sp.]|uniref:hypothetical protein n=1 Tax=uncultured Stenotrophomonas sp. TaxID=165438 RepID=UPI0025D487EC|nr:hypothetical protein [uncultured Stenotrophomonas sp.]